MKRTADNSRGGLLSNVMGALYLWRDNEREKCEFRENPSVTLIIKFGSVCLLHQRYRAKIDRYRALTLLLFYWKAREPLN
mmetsp:Transcript_10144/g.13262  ORF Transcript_10144/g.13262 Transcript_10144/m.13262 type:complete len:80 (-) Transcript_10144:104-343(-)